MVFLSALYSWHAPPSKICWVKEYLSVVKVFGASKSSDKQYAKETLFGFLECFLLGVWVNMLPSDWKGEPLCVPRRPGPKPAFNTICGGAKIKNVGPRQFWIGEKDSIVKYFPSRSNLAEIAGRRLHRLRITLHWLRRCIGIGSYVQWSAVVVLCIDVWRRILILAIICANQARAKIMLFRIAGTERIDCWDILCSE